LKDTVLKFIKKGESLIETDIELSGKFLYQAKRLYEKIGGYEKEIEPILNYAK